MIKTKENQGFTLIEVLIAMSVFAIGILAVWTMQIAAIHNNATAKLRTEATILAAKWAENRLSMDYATLPDGRNFLPTDPDDPAWYANVYTIEQFVALDNPIASTATIEIRVCWQENQAAPADCDPAAGRQMVSLSFVKANI
ncbi:MAG: prepilin-type N-terminal cleavage/methylation domain-containing protein [Desulfobacterales bacterium]|jgi:type IV pilus modification protein PilV